MNVAEIKEFLKYFNAVGYTPKLTVENQEDAVTATMINSAPEWLGYLLSELEQKEKERSGFESMFLEIREEQIASEDELQSAQGKIKSLQKQLDAKLTFINNGWEEERHVMQEDLISAQQEREHYFKLTQSATADNEKLRQEIERLKTALHTRGSYDKTVSEMYEREQKLIEGLQEYADGLVDRKLAKKILKELGVTE